MKNHKLPRDFRRRMDQFWDQYIEQGQASDEDKSDFYHSLTEGPKTGMQYLGRPEDLPALAERLQQTLRPLPWDKNHYQLERIPGTKAQAPGRDFFHDLGLIYIQEPAAAMPIASVNLSDANRILDLCAAPGGKSSQIYQQMNPEATLWANDVEGNRARILQQNMLRIGASNSLVSRADAANFADVDITFDFILLDAPCSGEALLRRKPQTAYQWRRYPPKVMARVQRQILDDIWPRLEPGGRLLYATCTYNSIENEELIAAFISEQEDARIIPFDHPRTEGIRAGLKVENCSHTQLAYRVFPQDGWGEGQFAILLEKVSHHTKARPNSPTHQGIQNIDLKQVLPEHEFLLHDEKLYAIRSQELACIMASPEMDFLKKGIYLGKYFGDELKPSKSWASLQAPDKWAKRIDLTDQPQMLADLRIGVEQRWPTDDEGLYLLTAYGRGIAWLDIRHGQRATLTLTQALRST